MAHPPVTPSVAATEGDRLRNTSGLHPLRLSRGSNVGEIQRMFRRDSRLVGWLVGWSVGRSVGWLVG